ncbi:MAG TPA: 4-(cytidine 5'-diphospho)-2-C-methyl-D-erythritol kinase [Ktedonobacterales bacterium]|nr:4-(cytidine 5'-diphospho)-2-C-methyl-D-erythritol kinase [Ktedonobacterales bacterium]
MGSTRADGWLFVRAYAKINLTLDVLGRRSDGYHELTSVMQTVALADTLAFRSVEEGRTAFFCDVPALNMAENLVYRAVQEVRAATGCQRGVRIELRKQTPAQGGLGGGSSDAAAVLLALNYLWTLKLEHAQLIELAARLGSDVPFFVLGGTALVEGRGERVTALPDLPGMWVLLLKPEVAVSTPAAFRALTPADYTDGQATARLVAAIRESGMPPLDGLVNALEERVCEHYPQVAECRTALLATGARYIRMSGSGPTLFALFPTLEEAAPAYQMLLQQGRQVWLARTVSRAEAPAFFNPG